MLIDLGILLALILLNGVFAMSEIAVVSSRRARLLQLAEAGSGGARHALSLAAEPTRFLSSVQVGITSIGILNGALGEGSIAGPVRLLLERVPGVAPYSETLSLVVMVVALTYVSLILGELVPKRLAMTNPEKIASIIARPMQVLATVGRPVVTLLSVSTDTVLRLVGVRGTKQPAVTLEEIRVMFQQGTEEGIVEPGEHQMVTNVLNLDERHVGAVLTPRADVIYLDLNDSPDQSRAKLRLGAHTVLPLCDGGLDHVVGFVRSTRVLEQVLGGQEVELRSLAEPALFVPETVTLMKLLDQLKRTHLPVALVIDEFGGVQGLVSLSDVMSSIVGDVTPQTGEDAPVVYREDGSWLMEGSLDIDAMSRVVNSDAFRADDDVDHYHTLGGLAMFTLGRVPRTGDAFEQHGFRFEVVDMDGNRVDRVLVSRRDPTRPVEASQPPLS